MLIQVDNEEFQRALDLLNHAADQGLKNITLHPHQVEFLERIGQIENGISPELTLYAGGEPAFTYPEVQVSTYRHGRSFPPLREVIHERPE